MSTIGSNLRKLKTGAQLQTSPHPLASKSFLYSNTFMAKSGEQSLTFKSVTDRQKTQRFSPPRRRVKSEPHQTWHGDRGPQARLGLTHSFAARGHWKCGGNQTHIYRDTHLQAVCIPHYGQISVKILVLGVLYPYRCTDGGEIRHPLPCQISPNRCNVSPLRGERRQNRPPSKLNSWHFALRAMLPVNQTQCPGSCFTNGRTMRTFLKVDCCRKIMMPLSRVSILGTGI